MPPEESPKTPTANASSEGIPPALVQQVTDMVYALLLRDLKLERERRGQQIFDQLPRLGHG